MYLNWNISKIETGADRKVCDFGFAINMTEQRHGASCEKDLDDLS